MKSKVRLVLIIVLLIIGNFFLYSMITEMLRQPSDSKVAMGVTMAVGLVLADIFIIKKLRRSR